MVKTAPAFVEKLPASRDAWLIVVLLLTATALAVPLALAAGECGEESRLSFDCIFSGDFGGRVPSQLQWSPDGAAVSYIWKDESGEALWTLDVGSGERRAVLRPAPDAEDGRLDLTAHHWSPGGDELLLEFAGGMSLLRLDDLSVHPLPDTDSPRQIPAFSPAGAHVAYVRDFDLFVVDLATGEERRLTTGGERHEVLNGITDWVYWEEIWGRRSTGFWWGPESRRIAYYRFDDSSLSSYPLVDFQAVPYPEVEWQKYPKAGTANPAVQVGVLDVATGETTWIDSGDDPDVYLARVDWRGDGKLAVQRLNREQNRLDLLLCDPSSGACETLLSEEWPTWINLHEDLTFLDDGGFVTSSEKSGWRRLYVHDADGHQARPLSPDGWAVTSLDALNEDEGWYVYTAFNTGRLGAKDRHVFRGRLADGSTTPMTSTDGWHSASVAPRTGQWIHRWNDADHPTQLVVRDIEGDVVADLPVEGPSGYDPAELPRWEFFTLAGPDGVELPAAMLEPVDFDSSRAYPAIMFHYGGPGSQVVTNTWGSRAREAWHKMMAQRGYVVLKVDNAASRFFGKYGEDLVHRRFGDVNLAAQLAGVEYLEGLGFVDGARIGLWGWSGGGANTLYSVLNSPGTWNAAISGAPVTDWRLYDSIWTERYLDHPEDNPEGYEQSSAVSHAARLRDNLLIIHGTADDNVHPQNTLAMTQRLIEAGVPFEHAIYPRQKHGFRGDASRHLHERMTEFFDRHLLSSTASD